MNPKRPETLTVEQGALSLEWGQESRRSWSLLLLVLTMARKVVIYGAPDWDWYIVHAMVGLASLRKENAERRICRCASLRSRSGMEVVAPKSGEFRVRLSALPVVDASEECIWRREECGGMTGLEFEDLQLKITVK